MPDYWKDNNLIKPQQVVVCAACRKDNIILAGARHYDKVMRSQARFMGMSMLEFEEGFIDQFGDFLTREEAMKIAIAAGQKVDIERGCGGDREELYSEGLY
jgi:hypothetical protein